MLSLTRLLASKTSSSLMQIMNQSYSQFAQKNVFYFASNDFIYSTAKTINLPFLADSIN